MRALAPPRTAVQKRAQCPDLVPTWSVAALTPAGPLRFPVDPALPASPKRRYRSAYRPPDPTRLTRADRTPRSDFERALHVIDCSPLEPALAQHYRPSAKGQVPFHPVSMLLAVALGRELDLSWRQLAAFLGGEHGAAWRPLFGFRDGTTPSASGLRYFFHAVGPDVVAELCPRFIDLLRAAGRFPEHSTFPGDPAARGVTVCQDGMLHPARHRQICQLATDACFVPLPTPPGDDRPGTEGPPTRPCRAREHRLPGCACTTPACHDHCVRASTRDPAARFIHYAGRSATAAPASAPATPKAATPKRSAKGTDVFGYRSVADRVLDDRVAAAWTVRSQLYPANTDERTIFPDRLQAFTGRFPDLAIGEWLDDAGVGFAECLDTIWALGALRMVDIRADPTDQDPAACLRRGYDGHGRPLCPHGYPLRANGYDSQRRRAKYLCHQACRREPRTFDGPVEEVAGCPYLAPATACGYVVNVGRTLPDGSTRLAREIPYGSAAWQARYGRRNLAESRNGQIEGMRLKRMRSYGQERAAKDVQLADFVINLRTLGRLVREATR